MAVPQDSALPVQQQPSWLLNEDEVKARVAQYEGRFRSVKFQSVGIISGWLKSGESVSCNGKQCTVDSCLYTVKDNATGKRFGLSGNITFADGTTLRQRTFEPHNVKIIDKYVHYRRRPHRDYIISANPVEEIQGRSARETVASPSWLLDRETVLANAKLHAGKIRGTRYQAIALVSGWIKAGDEVIRKGKTCEVAECLSRVIEVDSQREYALSGEVILKDKGSIKDRYSIPHNLNLLKEFVHDTGSAQNRYMIHWDFKQVPNETGQPRPKSAKIVPEIEQLETQLGLREQQNALQYAGAIARMQAAGTAIDVSTLQPGQLQGTPSTSAAGIIAPGTIAPGNLPPSSIAPGNLPPGSIAPGNLPPGSIASNLPPGSIAPGNLPPGSIANTFAPGTISIINTSAPPTTIHIGPDGDDGQPPQAIPHSAVQVSQPYMPVHIPSSHVVTLPYGINPTLSPLTLPFSG
eukprot:TRINITY_DN11252_c0_g3_i3.p1 TRINITY_DN11252_c0_g3~~TRINITY_DN11252_c0_g3_i3.p1  ORF type:complete len:495 (+),score=100.48 TRINITY_DN11252_c0_g3_i3:94-1485(+)